VGATIHIGNGQYDRQTARIRRHVAWIVLLSIPCFLGVEHTAGIYLWTIHANHAWNAAWAQWQAGWIERERIYRSLRGG
jgi:hypothetical protein